MTEFQPEPVAPVQPQQPTYAAPPAYGQPQQPTYAAPPVPYSAPSDKEGQPWVLVVLAGLAAGALAAFAYGAVSFLLTTEVLALVMGIGAAIGITVGRMSGNPGILSGMVAALIAVPSTLAALVLLVVFTVAGSIPDGLSVIGDVDPGTVLRLYFEDPLGYVWFAASVFIAFATGRKQLGSA